MRAWVKIATSTLTSLIAGAGSCSLINLSTSKPHKFPTIGETSAKYTTKNQWRFLYHLATKIFQFLKSKSKTDSHTSLTTWLASKFNLSSNYQNTWDNFKKICTLGLKEEDSTKIQTPIKYHESRLCFMGMETTTTSNIEGGEALMLKNALPKGGNLGQWLQAKNSLSNSSTYVGMSEFNGWTNNNSTLWNSFKDSNHGKSVANQEDISDSNIETAFNSWYQSNDAKVNQNQKLKEVINCN